MKKKLLILALIFLSLFSIRWIDRPERNNYFDIARNLDIFATLFREVNKYYVDEVDPNQMVAVGINAMLESLDPYTNYIPEERLESYRTLTTGQYAGIGMSVAAINNKVIVTKLFNNYSAHREGIQIGDEVISVNGKKVKAKNIPEISNLLKGQINSKVTVQVKRYGIEKPINFDLTREQITIGSVPYYGMIDTNTGYIKLDEFTIGAGRHVKSALLELKEHGAKAIVLDLRGNPGGLLSEAINVSNIFIEKGNPIVSTRGKLEDWNKEYKSLNNATDNTIPLAVLVDRGSASASEIVAGVIQDYDRGILLGQNTYGKGLVQTTKQLPYDARLKITTAKYYIPSGRCIQSTEFGQDNSGNTEVDKEEIFETLGGRKVSGGSGIKPDIMVKQNSYSPMAYALLHQGLINEFANRYYSENDTVETSRNFDFTGEDYKEFVSFVRSKEFKYSSPIEENINELKKNKDVQRNKKLQGEIRQLELKLKKLKENELIDNEEEITTLLSKAIIRRYYLYRGEIEFDLNHDTEIENAVSILSDSSRYNKLLQ